MCVIFKDLSAGFLVTPPAAMVSPHLMSPLASWDVFTGFSPNSGNDLAETLFPCTLRGQTGGCTHSANLSNTHDRKCEIPHVRIMVSVKVR